MRQYGARGAYCFYTNIFMRPLAAALKVESKTCISRESTQPQWHELGAPHMHIDLRIHVNLHILIDLLPTESQFKLLFAEPRWVLR